MEQKTYEGYGIARMLDVCKKYKLTNQNSDLYITNQEDLNSHWIIRTKKEK